MQEIVGERRESYERCIIQDRQTDYLSEANKFLQDGFYASVIGDTMPDALATALQTTIITRYTHCADKALCRGMTYDS